MASYDDFESRVRALLLDCPRGVSVVFGVCYPAPDRRGEQERYQLLLSQDATNARIVRMLWNAIKRKPKSANESSTEGSDE